MQEKDNRYGSDEQAWQSEHVFELTPEMIKKPESGSEQKPVSQEEPVLLTKVKKPGPGVLIEQKIREVQDKIAHYFAGAQPDGKPLVGSDGAQTVESSAVPDVHTVGFGVVEGPATAELRVETGEVVQKPESSFPATRPQALPQKAGLVGVTQELASMVPPSPQQEGVIPASARKALLQEMPPKRPEPALQQDATPKERPVSAKEQIKKVDVNAFIDSLEHQTVRDATGAEYRLEKLLGKGGMGFVMKAKEIKKAVLKKGEPAVPLTYKEMDPVTGEEVEKPVEIERAIKFILPDAAESEKAIARFEREIRISAMLTSPYVVKGLDRITVNVQGQELIGFVTEYVEGENLHEETIEDVFVDGVTRSRKRKLDPTLAVTYIGELMVALADLKSQGIIHRDLKPGNIILEDAGDGNKRVRLIDFGISKINKDELAEQHLAVQQVAEQLSEAQKEANASTIEALPGNLAEEQEQLVTPLTQEGLIFGTPTTMSPEQVRGRALTHQSDIYSSGVIFYDLLTGKGPYKETQKAEHQIVAHIVQQPRPFGEVGAQSVPEELQALVFDMLQKETSERTVDSMEVYSQLKRWVATTHPEMLNQEPWDFPYDHIPQDQYRKLAREARRAPTVVTDKLVSNDLSKNDESSV